MFLQGHDEKNTSGSVAVETRFFSVAIRKWGGHSDDLSTVEQGGLVGARMNSIGAIA